MIVDEIDNEGFRYNVGAIILHPDQSHVFWAKRRGQDSWQFPQGGVRSQESPTDTLWRELREETGLTPNQVSLIHESEEWRKYLLPKHFIRQNRRPTCIGQKQKWFLLGFNSIDNAIDIEFTNHPEFDSWRWINYWQPLNEVIVFKHDVYRAALEEFLSHTQAGPLTSSATDDA